MLKKWSLIKNATPAQLSLAWLQHQKPWIVPIPGSTQMPHMLENISAENVKFTAAEMQKFNKELNSIQVLGARLPDAVLQYSDVEAPLRK